MRTLAMVFGLSGYALFVLTLTYTVGFVTDVGVPRSVDSGGPAATPGLAILLNGLLLAVFAVQHTIMARPRFKRWLARFVPVAVERSVFVVAASLSLLLLMWQWRPIPLELWRVETPLAHAMLRAVCIAGFALAVYSSFLIDHFDLFGLRQTWCYFRGVPYVPRPFVERSLYRHVRHPLMLGFLIAFWATPRMTVGHFVLAALVTAYVRVGTWIEERGLLAAHGGVYAAYRARTPALLPRLRRADRAVQAEASGAAS